MKTDQKENIARKIPVLSAKQRKLLFGDYKYWGRGGGRIEIDADWVARNIVQARLSRADGSGGDVVTACHRPAIGLPKSRWSGPLPKSPLAGYGN